MGWWQMNTILDSEGFIDFAAFGIDDGDLQSLRALASIWKEALGRVVGVHENPHLLDDFVRLSGELPLSFGDIQWQREWMGAWHKLGGRGFSLADMFGFFNHAVTIAEQDLFGNQTQIGRVQFELFGILRRCVVAAISCAIELGEQAKDTEAGLPGEWAAVRKLREMGAGGRRVAVLSVSMVNRQTLSNLTASELQSLPGLLSEQLTGLLRPQDKAFIGHEGEWLLLLADVTSMAQPVLAASQIHRAFDRPVNLLRGRSVSLDASVGIAMYPENASEADEVVQAARQARASLQASRETFAIFDASMKVDWQAKHQLSEELREALRKDRLTLFLQPQVEIGKGCFGAELLLRWQRKSGEWVPPPMIVDIIEEFGWRAQFTSWLVRAALRNCAELDAAGIDVRLSLNLTAGDLLDTDLPELIGQCLASWRLPADRFTVELTESVMLQDRERGLAIMTRLREMGLRLALDDFGTGYSSLSYLATLPLNEIKIDRSFVVDMFRSVDKLRIVKTIIDLTHDLGMESLAEGVEDVAQRDQLFALGCTQIQGYLYAKPMPLPEFIAWYRTFRA